MHNSQDQMNVMFGGGSTDGAASAVPQALRAIAFGGSGCPA